MLILAVKEPAEKKQLGCGSWCCSKQTIKAHIFGPFLTYTLLFVKGCFLSDLTYLPQHVSSENIGHRYRRTPPVRKDRGERVSLPVFLGEGASVSAFFQKRSSRSVDIFVNARLSFSCSCGRTKMNCDVFEEDDHEGLNGVVAFTVIG